MWGFFHARKSVFNLYFKSTILKINIMASGSNGTKGQGRLPFKSTKASARRGNTRSIGQSEAPF